jgi:methylmalonyl-CoA mutase cobalamin-binding domain/chain
MAAALWASQNVFENTFYFDLRDPFIEKRKQEIKLEAMAVLTAALKKEKMLKIEEINETFWQRYDATELIDLIVESGKAGILDTPRAAGWDLKRYVKTHRDKDGIRRYLPGYTPLGVEKEYMPVTKEDVEMPSENIITRKEKVVLATVGADAHVEGINQVKEGFEKAGYEVIFMRGMNLPEAVAEVAAETNAKIVGASNLLGLGIELLPRLHNRLEELGLRDQVLLLGGGRIAEKEEEHQMYEEKINAEGPGFMGVDGFFGPGSQIGDIITWVESKLREREESGI